MTIFIVANIHPEQDATFTGRIAERFPSNYYEIGRGQWLVAFDGTAKALWEKLVGDADPATQRCVVFGIGGYWGVASRDIWEWMTTKLGGKIA